MKCLRLIFNYHDVNEALNIANKIVEDVETTLRKLRAPPLKSQEDVKKPKELSKVAEVEKLSLNNQNVKVVETCFTVMHALSDNIFDQVELLHNDIKIFGEVGHSCKFTLNIR